MNLLITGATGNVGGALLRHLAPSDHSIRALVRTPSTAQLPDDVEIVEGDLTNIADVRRALEGVDRAFLLLAEDHGAAFATAAGQLGLTHVVLLSSFTSTVPLPPEGRNVVTAKHRAGESALLAAGVPATVLRAAGFCGGITAWTPSISDAIVRAPYLDVALPIVDPDDIAACAAAAMLAETPPVGAYSITGPQALSVTHQTRILGELLGRTLRTEPITEQQAKDAVFPPGFPDLIASSILATASGAAAALPISTDVLEMTGRNPRTFGEWASEHLSLFA